MLDWPTIKNYGKIEGLTTMLFKIFTPCQMPQKYILFLYAVVILSSVAFLFVHILIG